MACDSDVNSRVSVAVELHEPDRTSSRDGGDIGATAKLKVLVVDWDNASSFGVWVGYYKPL
jgi:hypothetical protein